MNQKGSINTTLIAIMIIIIAVIAGYFVIFNEGVEHPVGDISQIFQTPGGCGNIFVHSTNPENNIGISVEANKETLKLSDTAQTFQLQSTDSESLRVQLLIGEEIGNLYCNDVIGNQPKYETELGIAGEVIITVYDIGESEFREGERNYTATVTLKNVQFVEISGEASDMYIEELTIEGVPVGWFAG